MRGGIVMANIKLLPAALDKMRRSSKSYVVYIVRRGGWVGSHITPAVRAGKAEGNDDYSKTEIEGIDFYVRKDMLDKKYEINWVGLWRIGQFVIKEV